MTSGCVHMDREVNCLEATTAARHHCDAARVEYRIETIGEGKYVEQLAQEGNDG
jgi:hypothetical protein